MTDTMFVAVMGLAGTLIGSLAGILAANRLTIWRIEQLEKKVDKHNSLIERMTIAEQVIKHHDCDIKELRGE